MTPFNLVIIGSLLIFGWGVYAEEAAKSIVPEPQIYYNLTMEEHFAKASEYANLVGRKRAHVLKRVTDLPVGGEVANDDLTMQALTVLNAACRAAYSDEWRAYRGTCLKNSRQISRGKPAVPNTIKTKLLPCLPTQVCGIFYAHNYKGNVVMFPFCGEKVTVQETLIVGGNEQEWEGHWFPQQPLQDRKFDHYAVLEEHVKEGAFQFEGTTSDGTVKKSFARGHSWSCIACPGGLLTVTSWTQPTFAIGWSSVWLA